LLSVFSSPVPSSSPGTFFEKDAAGDVCASGVCVRVRVYVCVCACARGRWCIEAGSTHKLTHAAAKEEEAITKAEEEEAKPAGKEKKQDKEEKTKSKGD